MRLRVEVEAHAEAAIEEGPFERGRPRGPTAAHRTIHPRAYNAIFDI